jgi:fatty acid desaturase
MVLTAAGVLLALSGTVAGIVAGVALLGAMFTHAVELQHQCLHHSAFRSARPHRAVGVLLGLPLLVSYSHYRVRHLQHHRYLGTKDDSEFFGFDVARGVSWANLLSGLLDYRRLLLVLRDVARSAVGSWQYRDGQISAKGRRDVMAEYRLIGVLLGAAVVLSAAGFGRFVLLLWVLPLVVAVPLHFLVELPEHILCDRDTTDVLRNTRSITGSRLSTWYTNSNNLHVEHHLTMRTPLQRLPKHHDDVRQRAVHVERSYWQFYRLVLRQARLGAGR